MKSKSLFHTLCCQTQLDTVCPGKLTFLVCHNDQGRAQSKFQEISPLLQKKTQNRLQKNFPRGGKSWRPATRHLIACHTIYSLQN